MIIMIMIAMIMIVMKMILMKIATMKMSNYHKNHKLAEEAHQRCLGIKVVRKKINGKKGVRAKKQEGIYFMS